MKKHVTFAVFILINPDNRVKPTEETIIVEMFTDEMPIDSKELKNLAYEIVTKFFREETVRDRVNNEWTNWINNGAILCHRVYSNFDDAIYQYDIKNEISVILKERLFSLQPPVKGERLFYKEKNEVEVFTIKEIKPFLQEKEMSYMLSFEETGTKRYVWWTENLLKKQKELEEEFNNVSL